MDQNLKTTLTKVIARLKNLVKQPDWGQNDSSQPDFIQNRTHWIEYVPTRYSNSDVNFAESGYSAMAQLYGYNQYPQGFLDNFTTGNELAVEVDGVVRRGIIRNLNSSYWIGNGHMLLQSAEDTGEDWCVGTMSIGFDSLRVILPPSYEGTHDVDVILSEQTVHKLDAKFLPEVLNDENITIVHHGVSYKLSDAITALINANILE